MALQIFTPAVQPSPGTGMTPEISLHEVPFGDGYTLSSPNGINHIRQKLSLKWDGLTLAQHDLFKNFFEEHMGYLPFYYMHPMDGVMRKWTCKSWSSGFGIPSTFNAELVQNFSLTA